MWIDGATEKPAAGECGCSLTLPHGDEMDLYL